MSMKISDEVRKARICGEQSIIPRLRFASPVVALLSLGFFPGIATTRQNQSPPTEPTTLLSTVAPLTQAVLRRDVTRLQQLLEAGEDPDKRDEQGHAPWM